MASGLMDEYDCVNLFLSEGAVHEVVEAMEAAGRRSPATRSATQIDKINPGAWFAKQFAEQPAPTRCWCRRAATRAPRPPTMRTSP